MPYTDASCIEMGKQTVKLAETTKQYVWERTPQEALSKIPLQLSEIFSNEMRLGGSFFSRELLAVSESSIPFIWLS